MSLSLFFMSEKRPAFLKEIRCRPMFGGHGYFVNGRMFALVREKSLYLRAGSSNVADYLLRGQLPYIHQCFGEYFPTNFYSVPKDVVDSEEELLKWVTKAVKHTKMDESISKNMQFSERRNKKTTGVLPVISNTLHLRV